MLLKVEEPQLSNIRRLIIHFSKTLSSSPQGYPTHYRLMLLSSRLIRPFPPDCPTLHKVIRLPKIRHSAGYPNLCITYGGCPRNFDPNQRCTAHLVTSCIMSIRDMTVTKNLS